MKDSKEIDKIIANTSASLAVDGMHPSEKGVSITRLYLEGKIGSKEAIKRIINMYLHHADK